MLQMQRDMAKVGSGAINEVRSSYMKNIAGLNDFALQAIKAKSSTQQFTEALAKHDITLRQAIKSRQTFNDVLREQYQLQKMTTIQWQKDAAGTVSADVIVPRGSTAELDHLTGSLGNNLKAIASAKRGTDEYNTAVDMLKMRVGMANQVLASGAENMVNWGKNTQWAGRQLMVGFTVPFVAFGAVAGMAAYNANKALTQIEKVYDTSANNVRDREKELGQVRQESMQNAIQVAKAYGASVKDTLDAEGQLAAAGMKGMNLIKATNEVQRAAILGEMNQQDTIKATIAMQSIYGYSTKQLADAFNYMNATENATVLTMQDFVQAIPRAAGPLHELGGNIQDLGLMLVAMKSAGVDAAIGANALKSSLGSLINPSKTALKEIDKLTHGTVNLPRIVEKNGGDYVKTMTEFASQLENAFAGLTDQQKSLNIERIVEAVFGKQQYARIGGIIQQLAKVHDTSTQVGRQWQIMQQGAAGWSQVAQQEMQRLQESTSQQLKRTLETLKGELAQMGQPFLVIANYILKGILGIVGAFNKLPGGVKMLAALVLGVLAIAGPLIMITGLAANMFGQFLKGVSIIAGVTSRFRAMTMEQKAAQMMAEQNSVLWQNQANSAQLLSHQIKGLTEQLMGLAAEQRALGSTKLQMMPNGRFFNPDTKTFATREELASYNSYQQAMWPVNPGWSNLGGVGPALPGAGAYKLNSAGRPYDPGTGRFISPAEFQAMQAAEKSAAQIAKDSEASGRSWSKIADHAQGLAVGGAMMAQFVAGGNALVSKLADAVMLAGLIGPTVMKTLGKTEIGAAALGGMKSLGSTIATAIGGRAGSAIGVLRTGLMGLARFAGPIGIGLTAAYFAYSKITAEAKRARAEQEAIDNSAKGWASTLGFVYTEAAAINGKLANNGKTVDLMATKWADANKELAKYLQGLFQSHREQDLINAAIQEGVKVRSHGGSADDAIQAVKIALKASGMKDTDVEMVVNTKILPKIDFNNAKKTLDAQMTGFANDFNRITQNHFKQGKWEGFSRIFSGTDDLNNRAGQAARDMGKEFWNNFAAIDMSNLKGRRDYWDAFDKAIEESQKKVFDRLHRDTKATLKQMGIDSIDEFTKAQQDYAKYAYNPAKFDNIYGKGSFLAFGGIQGQDLENITKAQQAEEQLAQTIAKQNGISGKALSNIHTLADVQRTLGMATMSVDDAQKAYNTRLDAMIEKHQRLNPQAALHLLNMYRLAAGLPPATSAEQGFGDAIDATTGALKNQKSELDNTSTSVDDYVNALKSSMQGAQDFMISQASKIWDQQAQAQQDGIQRAADAQVKALDNTLKTYDNSVSAQARDMDRKYSALNTGITRRYQAQAKAITKSYDDRIKAAKKALANEQNADKERQRIFEAEKARLQQMADMANQRIDFNTAINTGNLDQAAKVYNNMQASQTKNALDAALAGATDTSQNRQDALSATVDALTNERDARLASLQKMEDAEKQALQAKKDREKQALDAEKQRYHDSIQAQQDAIRQKAQNDIKANQDELARQKATLDAELASIQASIPRDEKEYQDHIGRIEKLYSKYGVDLKGYAADWSQQIGANLTNHINAAESALEDARRWKQISANITDAYTEGAFGLNSQEFAKWVTTGELPKSGLNPGKTSPKASFHSGGLLGSGTSDRLGRTGPLWGDEEHFIGQKGEYVVKKPVVDAIGTDFLDALNSGHGIGGPDLALGLPGISAAVMAGGLRRIVQSAIDYMGMQAQGITGDYVASAGGEGKYGGVNLSPEQLRNAAQIIQTGKRLGATQRDLVVGIMTAMQESGLRNINYGDRDSLGLFQQRPSQGWGTPEQILNPTYAATQFFDRLLAISDRNKMPLTLEAQAVQRSAFPNAYAQWQAMAEAVVGGTKLSNKGFNIFAQGAQGAQGGFQKPLDNYVVASPYGMRVNPITGKRALHNGIDLAAPFGTPIHAVANGKVIFAGPNGGYGNWTVLDHGDGILSAYAHQSLIDAKVGQGVRRGQIIGEVGSTGASTGPHLHFMLSRGASVGNYGSWQNPKMLLPSLKVGGDVRYDNTIANLHAGEKVLTAPLSKSLEDGINNLDANGGNVYDIDIDLRGALVRSDVDIENAIHRAIAKIESKKGRSRSINN